MLIRGVPIKAKVRAKNITSKHNNKLDRSYIKQKHTISISHS